jgi:peptidylprolyl isomerase
VSTNKQRREAERRRLQRQLEQRRAREASRRRTTTIASVVGALVLVAAIVVVIVVSTGGSDKKKTPAGAAAKSTSAPATPTTAASSAATCGSTTFPTKKYANATGKTVTFDGVSVGGAADLQGIPKVTSTSSTTPTKLAVKDLVVGTGAAATATSCVDVQYTGVLYKTGKEFDSSWSRGQVAEFSLEGVIKGFTQGIGGGSGVAPMKVGGRRIIIIPSALGYGAQANNGIPANSPLVFVVDLTKISSLPAS